jgi:hypothetical protein
MKKQVKIQIDIDNDNFEIGRGSFVITDMLFTDLSSRLFEFEDIILRTKKAIKRLGGYKTITITITKGNQNELYPSIISSVRILNSYGIIEVSDLNGNSYNNWKKFKNKFIYKKLLKEYVDASNKEFLNLKYEIENAVPIKREKLINDIFN